MKYQLTCECGQPIVIRSADAGTVTRCACGRDVNAPSLSELRKLAPYNTAAATPPGPQPDAAIQSGDDRRILAGRGAVVETCIGAVAIEALAIVVVAVFAHALASAIFRLPIHLLCFWLLWGGVRGSRWIYGLFLLAVGGVSLLQVLDQGDYVLKAIGILAGPLFILFGCRMMSGADIAAFVRSQRRIEADD